MWWFGYAKAGREFEVQQSLRDLGIRCEVPRKVEAKRVPTKRMPVAVTTPYLGNYVFIECSGDQWHLAHTVKHLASTMVPIGQREAERDLASFMRRTEDAYQARAAAIEAGERVVEYKQGDTVEILSGPLAGKLATFRRIVETAQDLFPRLEADVVILGGTTKVNLDPIHARRHAST